MDGIYCIVLYLYIYIRLLAEALPMRETQREGSSLEKMKGAWLPS